MGKVRNVLFIMCDQLRADYLSCMGHPTLETPHIDALAAKGVRFTRAFTQSSVCGPSRMSFYTGRYMVTHGANWNRVPLPLNIRTMGDHLRTLGARVALAGKTHMQIDQPGLDRLGIDRTSPHGVLATQAGFEPFDRDDGLHPGGYGPKDFAYNRYLNELGYEGENPWQDYCAAALDGDGNIVNGWEMRNAGLPARVKEIHSETAYMTRRAQDFMEECGDDRHWCLHLSYIKPHWPYLAPAPYHAMYGPGDIVPAVRSERERQTSHPVYAAFQQHEDSQSFSRDEVRETVIPTYMGLVKQIDDHLGKLFQYMERTGRMDDTMIVLTSDHGDYLGDHWLGEKELFHDCVLRLPMIVYDPDPAADATRGAEDDRFVECIDLLPTFYAAMGGDPAEQDHWMEGRSILPLLRNGDAGGGAVGTPAGAPAGNWRDATFSECDYSYRQARDALGLRAHQAKAYCIRTADWKYILYEGFRPQLFDMANDPDELVDLGESDEHEAVRAELHERLFQWLRTRRTRTTRSDREIEVTLGRARKLGVLIGVW